MKVNKTQFGFFKPSRQKGLTLIELMIASTLGVIALGGMYSLFALNKETIRVQTNIYTAQEKANFALDIIAEDIRQAGYPGVFSTTGTDPFGEQTDVGYPRFGDTGSRFDSIAVSRMARVADPSSADVLLQQNEMDCLGNIINVPDAVLTHRYFVNANRELVCQSILTGGQAVVANNVAAFQVLYGIDTVAGACPNPLPGLTTSEAAVECMLPTVYVSGAQLEATLNNATPLFPVPGVGAGLGVANTNQLQPVKSVRIAIAIDSEEGDLTPAPTINSYRIFEKNFVHNSEGVSHTDGNIRRYAVRTVGLRQASRGP